MREIKFRIWVGELSKFVYWGFIPFENKLPDHEYAHTWEDPWCVLSNCNIKLTQEQVHIQSEQYTGLKDKDGVEIWEGDLVQTGAIPLREVMFEQGCSVVEHLGEYFRMMPEFCKVVGNIHEGVKADG